MRGGLFGFLSEFTVAVGGGQMHPRALETAFAVGASAYLSGLNNTERSLIGFLPFPKVFKVKGI